ncbi:phosphinothricin acetyltransferase [Capnocytophaga ochracea]|nr:phosphinothricin acetyltransferase [Capnocytophaga ochracea]MEB3015484.1 phosphinothricin acetyltransferase [Capnocytophaga ochracea]MEB3035857.1 phosphinothricin acetyltransferase [Capnocytophaga ochracea]
MIYSVGPRTPEGGQAGKADKLLPLHILRSRGLPFKGGIRDGKGVRS